MKLFPDSLGQHKSIEKSDDEHKSGNDSLIKTEILVSTPLLLLHAISTSAKRGTSATCFSQVPYS